MPLSPRSRYFHRAELPVRAVFLWIALLTSNCSVAHILDHTSSTTPKCLSGCSDRGRENPPERCNHSQYSDSCIHEADPRPFEDAFPGNSPPSVPSVGYSTKVVRSPDDISTAAMSLEDPHLCSDSMPHQVSNSVGERAAIAIAATQLHEVVTLRDDDPVETPPPLSATAGTKEMAADLEKAFLIASAADRVSMVDRTLRVREAEVAFGMTRRTRAMQIPADIKPLPTPDDHPPWAIYHHAGDNVASVSSRTSSPPANPLQAPLQKGKAIDGTLEYEAKPGHHMEKSEISSARIKSSSYAPRHHERFATLDGQSCGSSGALVVSLEGLELLLTNIKNVTVAASLQKCLNGGLRSPADTLNVAVQSCLLQHNVVGSPDANKECQVHGTLGAQQHLECVATGGAWSCSHILAAPVPGPRVRCQWGQVGAPGSAVAYIAAVAGPGQLVQWQAQLAKVHHSVQHLPLDRECEPQPRPEPNLRPRPPVPGCLPDRLPCPPADAFVARDMIARKDKRTRRPWSSAFVPEQTRAHERADNPVNVHNLVQHHTLHVPKVQSGSWMQPWVQGLFPGLPHSECPECADCQLATDMAAALKQRSTVKESFIAAEIQWSMMAAATAVAAFVMLLTWRDAITRVLAGSRPAPLAHPSPSQLRHDAACSLRNARATGQPGRLAAAIRVAEERGVAVPLLNKARQQLKQKQLRGGGGSGGTAPPSRASLATQHAGAFSRKAARSKEKRRGGGGFKPPPLPLPACHDSANSSGPAIATGVHGIAAEPVSQGAVDRSDHLSTNACNVPPSPNVVLGEIKVFSDPVFNQAVPLDSANCNGSKAATEQDANASSPPHSITSSSESNIIQAHATPLHSTPPPLSWLSDLSAASSPHTPPPSLPFAVRSRGSFDGSTTDEVQAPHLATPLAAADTDYSDGPPLPLPPPRYSAPPNIAAAVAIAAQAASQPRRFRAHMPHSPVDTSASFRPSTPPVLETQTPPSASATSTGPWGETGGCALAVIMAEHDAFRAAAAAAAGSNPDSAGARNSVSTTTTSAAISAKVSEPNAAVKGAAQRLVQPRESGRQLGASPCHLALGRRPGRRGGTKWSGSVSNRGSIDSDGGSLGATPGRPHHPVISPKQLSPDAKEYLPSDSSSMQRLGWSQPVLGLEGTWSIDSGGSSSVAGYSDGDAMQLPDKYVPPLFGDSTWAHTSLLMASVPILSDNPSDNQWETADTLLSSYRPELMPLDDATRLVDFSASSLHTPTKPQSKTFLDADSNWPRFTDDPVFSPTPQLRVAKPYTRFPMVGPVQRCPHISSGGSKPRGRSDILTGVPPRSDPPPGECIRDMVARSGLSGSSTQIHAPTAAFYGPGAASEHGTASSRAGKTPTLQPFSLSLGLSGFGMDGGLWAATAEGSGKAMWKPHMARIARSPHIDSELQDYGRQVVTSTLARLWN